MFVDPFRQDALSIRETIRPFFSDPAGHIPHADGSPKNPSLNRAFLLFWASIALV